MVRSDCGMNFSAAAAAPREIDGASSAAAAPAANVRRLIIEQILPAYSGERILPPRLLRPVYWDCLLGGKVIGTERTLLVDAAGRLAEPTAIVMLLPPKRQSLI